MFAESITSSRSLARGQRGRFLRASNHCRLGIFSRFETAGLRSTSTGTWIFPTQGSERRLDDPGPLIEEFEALLRQAVERRLRSDVPVVSYISGGLDSTVVLGMCSQQRRAAIPSFTIGLDRAGPDERAQAAEAAAMLGSPLFTTTVDQAGIAAAYPELVRAAECPVLDTSCAALLRLAQSVHEQGYKVVLTGEGADEALAGYVWYKVQIVGRCRDSPCWSGPTATALVTCSKQVLRAYVLHQLPSDRLAEPGRFNLPFTR